MMLHLENWIQNRVGGITNHPIAISVSVNWEGHGHVNGVPCGWDVLVTDKGAFYRPDTYWYMSPYGWRPVFWLEI